MVKQIEKELRSYAKRERAVHSSRFFKTGKGEYGEGDMFLGINNPSLRLVVKKYYKDISIDEVLYFVQSDIHDFRLFGLILWTYQFPKVSEEEKKKIYDLYLSNTGYINNWDLVDLSAYKIVGKYLLDKDRDILYTLASSSDLWEQRISIISTWWFIHNDEFKDTLKISEMLLNHDHDLIHKAVGWMLREVGKRDLEVEEEFLKKHYMNMPRTMLRYAIERFEEGKRQRYLKGDI